MAKFFLKFFLQGRSGGALACCLCPNSSRNVSKVGASDAACRFYECKAAVRRVVGDWGGTLQVRRKGLQARGLQPLGSY